MLFEILRQGGFHDVAGGGPCHIGHQPLLAVQKLMCNDRGILDPVLFLEVMADFTWFDPKTIDLKLVVHSTEELNFS